MHASPQPRQAVLDLAAYVAPTEGRYGKVRLDFNENTVGFPHSYNGLSTEYVTTYPEYDVFIAKLAAHYDIPPDCLLLTNGSDEALFLIASTFIEPNVDAALVSSPTFPMIPHYLKLAQATIHSVSVCDDTLAFDVSALTESLQNTQPKLALFASPDNPTGSLLPAKQALAWCKQFPNTLFTIDEAYVEYGGTSVLQEVLQYPNLIVTRTFSKAWGLAGLRLGVVIAQPELIQYLRCVRSPYSVNTLSLLLAEPMLAQADSVLRAAQETMVRKANIIAALAARGYRVVEGAANFFLLCVGLDAGALTSFCESHGVLIRDRSSLPTMWGMIRVSVGTEAEMAQFLDCIDDFKAQRALIFDLDDTLVDTRESYDATIAELVEQYSGQPLKPDELKHLRALGGYNDDWDATVALLASRGVTVTREEIEETGKAAYLRRAPAVENFMVDLALLDRIKNRYRVLIVTGRPRDEYVPVWASRLDPLFEAIYCQDDVENARRKPAPDLLLAAMRDKGIGGGLYLGNAVDDMQAALAAGLTPLGVTTTQPADILTQAGAQYTWTTLNDLEKGLML